jgi:GTP cyclohydrolase FolE2
MRLADIRAIVSRPGETDLGREILVAELIALMNMTFGNQLHELVKRQDWDKVRELAAALRSIGDNLYVEACAAATAPSKPDLG